MTRRRASSFLPGPETARSIRTAPSESSRRSSARIPASATRQRSTSCRGRSAEQAVQPADAGGAETAVSGVTWIRIGNHTLWHADLTMRRADRAPPAGARATRRRARGAGLQAANACAATRRLSEGTRVGDLGSRRGHGVSARSDSQSGRRHDRVPADSAFDPFHLSRIQALDAELGRWFVDNERIPSGGS